MLNKIRSRTKRELAKWSLNGGTSRRRFYYRFLSDAFLREEDAVSAGIQNYDRSIGSGADLFLIRRNVHMIEKGLTMQPRREEFAVEYIKQTVTSFIKAVEGGQLSPTSPEWDWMHSVLSDYFEATKRSASEVIREAGRRFVAFENGTPSRTAGPHAPEFSSESTGIEPLTELAKHRRSVRWFTDERIERGVVDNAVAVAAESPTACNRQPYRFEIFDDAESVRKVASIPMGTRGYVHQIPGIIVIIGDLSAFFDERDRHLIYVDSCLSAMSLVLGLESQGVGSCCINWPDMPEKESAMRKLLGLKAHERVIMLIAYGKPDPNGLVPFSAKKQLNQFREYRTV